MRINSDNKSKYFGLIFILIILFSCQETENEECLKYEKENYTQEIIDTSLINGLSEYNLRTTKSFNENSIKGLKYEAYQFQFYSSHGFGRLIRFDKKIGGCSIRVKCKNKEGWDLDCKEYYIGIGEENWNELEKMIYEFNFWTAENYRGNNNVLDGYIYFLEGNRPDAEKCNKKTYKLVGRGSPKFDKIEALCENILKYEEQLKSEFERLNKI